MSFCREAISPLQRLGHSIGSKSYRGVFDYLAEVLVGGGLKKEERKTTFSGIAGEANSTLPHSCQY